jgi:hypothetical protein
LEAVNVPAEMAEEMSGREPTFCCSKDGLRIYGQRTKNKQEQKPMRGFFPAVRMTSKSKGNDEILRF